MRYLILRIAVVLLAFQGLAVAQHESAGAPPQIKTSITIDSTTLARDKPALVTITLENVSGKELELSYICSFNLDNLSKESLARKHQVIGDSFWGPVNISTSTPMQLDIIDPEKQKQGITVGRVPQVPLQFAKDETKTFKVDLSKLIWGDSMHSIWPNQSLFKVVPKGSYALSFELSQKGVNLRSNPVEVSVK
jgi:hypothetical protein